VAQISNYISSYRKFTIILQYEYSTVKAI